MLFYRAALPLSRQDLTFVSGQSAAPEGDRLVLRELNPAS
jgi:hypothetical protein